MGQIETTRRPMGDWLDELRWAEEDKGQGTAVGTGAASSLAKNISTVDNRLQMDDRASRSVAARYGCVIGQYMILHGDFII